MSYLLLILVTLALGMGSQAAIRSQYKTWRNVTSNSLMTGAQAARKMLDANGLYNINITLIAGDLTDNFDPRDNALHLSQGVYGSTSVAAIAIACHEAGHALQHNLGYTPIKVRTAIFPVVNACSNAWLIILMIGIFMNLMGFIELAIILYAAVVLFQLVTLPVEFNASHRAMEFVTASCGLPADQNKGAHNVLTAAALTYVAAALASLLQLVYLLGSFDRD